MAAPDVDLDSLSDDQRQTLDQFVAVTNAELPNAIPILQRSQWNVQVGFLLAP
jgi:FAS-associated factor 2